MPYAPKAMTYKQKSRLKVNYQKESKAGTNSLFLIPNWRHWLPLAHKILILSLLSAPLPSFAQSSTLPAEDTTLPENTIVQSSGNNEEILIEGGTRRDSNLFHSFSEFNIDEGQAVYFNPEAGVENILSRVTGGRRSDISGTLGVNGTASLWLINPNGIVFGENATLDIAGSFYATTAPAVSMGDGLFSAIAPQASSLLSVSPEVSFQTFLNDLTEESQNIIIRNELSVGGDLGLAAEQITAAELDLAAGNNLLLVTDINAARPRSINAQGIDVELTATAGSIEVSPLTTGNRNNRNTRAGNVRLEAQSNITTRGINSSATSAIGNTGNGGDIWIQSSAGNIINEGVLSTRSDSSDPDKMINGNAGNGGNIAVQIEGNGNIINREELLAQSRATRGNAGEGGNVSLSIGGRGNIVNEQPIRVQSRAVAGSAGNGGSINIETNNGSVLNQQPLSSSSSADIGTTGNGGSITVTAIGDITNINSLNSFSFSKGDQAGNGGEISLLAIGGNITNLEPIRSLSISDSGNAGLGGNISMTATGNGIIANYGEINAQSLANGSGENSGNAMSAGDITVQTDSGDIISRPIAADTGADDNSGSFNTRSVSRAGTTNTGGDISILSESGNIFLNAYITAKSYSINDAALSGGNIIVSTRLGSIVGERLGGSLRTGIITSSISGQTTVTEESNQERTGGSVVLQAGDTISGLNIFTLSDIGRSGNIVIQGTGDLRVEETQIITNEEFVTSNFDRTNLNGTRLFPSNLFGNIEGVPVLINSPRSGQPGDVWVTSTGDLTTSNFLVSNDANSPKNAGDITLSSNTLASPLEELSSSDYTPSLRLSTSNPANNTAIRLFDSRLATNTISDGSGGDITLQRANAVVLDNTDLETNTAGIESARAGNISITGSDTNADYVLLRGGSSLLADAQGQENGGTVKIQADRVIASPDGNNDIIVNASAGDAGNIFSPGAILYGFEEQQGLTTDQLRGRRSNDISASSQTGQNGIITIDALVNAPIREESETLSEDFSNPEQLISNSCIAGDIADNGRFTIPGTGNFPSSPNNSTASTYDLDDVEILPTAGALTQSLSQSSDQSSERFSQTSETATASQQTTNQQTTKEWQLGDPVVEPEEVEQLADGRVVFGQQCHAQ